MALLPYYLPFFGGMGAQEAAQAYGMVGGVPCIYSSSTAA